MAASSRRDLLALRAETGAPVVDCDNALREAGGNLAKARELLRARGKVVAAAKGGRAAGEGTIGVYVHQGGRVAGLVLLRCETDFVARHPTFATLAKDLAMQVVALHPAVVRPEEAPAGTDPKATALLAQTFVKDESGRQTVADLLAEKVLELGENIVVEKFARFSV